MIKAFFCNVMKLKQVTGWFTNPPGGSLQRARHSQRTRPGCGTWGLSAFPEPPGPLFPRWSRTSLCLYLRANRVQVENMCHNTDLGMKQNLHFKSPFPLPFPLPLLTAERAWLGGSSKLLDLALYACERNRPQKKPWAQLHKSWFWGATFSIHKMYRY